MKTKTHGLYFESKKDGTVGVHARTPRGPVEIAVLRKCTAAEIKAALADWNLPRNTPCATSKRRVEACRLLEAAGLILRHGGTLGARLLAARKAAGLSQSEVGKQTEMDQSLISKYERDECETPVSVLRKLAEAYGVTCGSLLD